MGVVFWNGGPTIAGPWNFVDLSLPQHPDLVIEEIMDQLVYGSSIPFLLGFP